MAVEARKVERLILTDDDLKLFDKWGNEGYVVIVRVGG